MHGLHRSLLRRLEALELRLGDLPETETPEQTVRRLELSKAALNGIRPADLLEEERETFEKALLFAPIFMELVHEGTLDGDDEEGAIWRP